MAMEKRCIEDNQAPQQPPPQKKGKKSKSKPTSQAVNDDDKSFVTPLPVKVEEKDDKSAVIPLPVSNDSIKIKLTDPQTRFQAVTVATFRTHIFNAPFEIKMSYRLKRNTPLGKVLDGYYKHQNMGKRSAKLIYGNRHCHRHDTPEQMGMEDGDEICLVTDEVEEEVPASNEPINIKLTDQFENEMSLRIKRSTPLGKVLDAYYEQHNMEKGSAKLIYGDRYCRKHNTPDQMGMEDDDEIWVVTHQHGGGFYLP